jgi:hypothetical protein
MLGMMKNVTLRLSPLLLGLIAAMCLAAPRWATAQPAATEPATEAAHGAATAPATRPMLSQSDPAATRVTLHIASVPRTMAFAQLAAASGIGNPTGAAAAKEPTITVDADDQPYWNVMLPILDQSRGIDLSSAAIGLPAAGAPGDALSGMRSIDGAFVLCLNRWDRTIGFTGPSAPVRQATLEAHLAFEPRLGVLYMDRTIAPTLAVDENGLSLVPRGDDPQPPRAFNDNPCGLSASSIFWPLTIDMNVPPSAGRRVARMSVKVRAWVAQETRTFRFPFGQEKTESTGTVNCKVTWSGSNDEPKIEVRFDRGSIKPETWQDMAAFLSASRVRVVDDAGAPWTTDTNRNDGDSQDDHVTIQRTFTRPQQPAGKPAPAAKNPPTAAIVDIPVAVKPIELHFSFADIPVP